MPLIAFFTGRATWATSFQYRDFRLLWSSTLIHSLGTGMEQVALGWLVLEMTDSPLMLGVSSAVRMAPMFFLGLLSGAVADRADRRMLLRLVTLSGSIVGALMVLVLVTGQAQVWHVMILAAAGGCVWAFTFTARQAYTYDIVGPQNALNGLSLNDLSHRVGGVVGSIFAGVIIATVGMGGQYLAITISFVAAFAVLLATRDGGQAAPLQRESVFKSLTGCIRLIRENRTLMILMLLTAATEVFGFTNQSLLPIFARDVLVVGPVGLGIMTAVRQGGGALGLIVLANLGDFRRKGALMFMGSIGFGLSQMILFLASNWLLFLVVLAIINACAAIADTLYKMLMQSNVPNEQRGRAMGSWVLSIGVAPVGHVGIGAVAGALGAPGAILVNGSILAFIGISTAIGLPRIRRLE